MKLVFCANCRDVLKLTSPAIKRSCVCGKSSGHYMTDDPGEPRSVILGDYAHVIAISNDSLIPIVMRVSNERPDNAGKDHYVGVDDYWLERNTLAAWVYGPNARELTRNTTLKTPITTSTFTPEKKRTKTPRALAKKAGKLK
jgi:hypothetical protein